jgi:hypothetical protein
MRRKNGKLKRLLILLVLGIFFIQIIANSDNSKSYFDDSENLIDLNYTYVSNSEEICDSMGSISNYSNFESIEFDNDELSHELSKIDISRLQMYNNTNHSLLPFNNTAVSTKGLNFTAYECSAPFDTAISSNISYYNNNTEGASDVSVDECLSTSDNITFTTIWNETNVLFNDAYYDGTVGATITEDQTYQGKNAVYMQDVGSGDYIQIKYSHEPMVQGYIDFYIAKPTASTSCTFQIGGYSTNNEDFANMKGWKVESIGNGLFADGVNKKTLSDATWAHVFIEFDCLTQTYNCSVDDGAKTTDIAFDYYLPWLDSIGFWTNAYNPDSTIWYVAPNATANYEPEHEIEFSFENDVNEVLNNTIEINGSYSSSVDLRLDYNSSTYLLNASETTFSFLETFHPNQSVIISFNSSFSGISLDISSLLLRFSYNEFDSIVMSVNYSINSIDYVENITAYQIDYSANLNLTTVLYKIDSSQLLNYDYINDLYINQVNITLDCFHNFTLNISYFTSTSQWVVPSEIDLRLNDNEVIDQSYNSGYVSLLFYQNYLDFTAISPNILFNFTITSYYTQQLSMNVISKTYLDKTIILTSNHNLTLTQVDILFDADILHTYINNLDYSDDFTFYPSLFVNVESSLHFEIILAESTYLELDDVSLLSNQSSSFFLFASSNSISYSSISDLNYIFSLPDNFILENSILSFSNLLYEEPYLHIENNSYSETYGMNPSKNTSLSYSNYTNSLESYNVSSQSQSHSINLTSEFEDLTNNFKVADGVLDWGISGIPSVFSPDITYIPDSYVIEISHANHKYPLKLADSSSWGSIHRGFTNDSGGVSFWAYIDTTSNGYIFSGSTSANFGGWSTFGVFCTAGNVNYLNSGGGWADSGYNYAADTWHHFHIDYEKGVNQKIYLDGTKIVDTLAHNLSPTHLRLAVSQETVYFDALGIEDGFVKDSNRIGNVISNITDISITDISITDIELHQVKNFSISSEFVSNQSYQISELNHYCFFDNSFDSIHPTINESDSFTYSLENYSQNYFASNMSYRLQIIALNSSSFDVNFTFSINISYYCPDPLDVLPSLALGYEKKVYVNETNTIEINIIKSYFDISSVLIWNNITGVNETIGTAEGTFYKNFCFNESLYYSIEVFVNDSNQNYRKIRVDDIFVMKNATSISYSSLSNIYYQDSSINISGILRENGRLLSEIVNLTLKNPNGSICATMNDSLYYFIGLNTTGFYSINFSYSGSCQYLQSSIELVLEILPIQTSVNITFAELYLNGLLVNSTNYSVASNNLSISGKSGLIFDLEISFNLSYTRILTHYDLLHYRFEFNQTSLISNINISNCYLNEFEFSQFYLNYYSGNYSVVDSHIVISDLFNITLYNADSFDFFFTHNSSEFLIQLDNRVFTNTNSVNMKSYKQSDRVFSYWYFDDELDVNSLTIEQLRTGSLISSTNESSKYYFVKSSLSGDLFEINYDLNPHFVVSYKTLELDDMHAKLNVSVSSSIYLENITVVFEYPSFVNWNRGYQNLDNEVLFNISSVSTETQYFEIVGSNLNYNSTYSVIDSNSTAIELEYSIFGYSEQFNIADSIDLNGYYGLWECSNLSISQDYYSELLSFTIPTVNLSIQTYRFKGFITDLNDSVSITYNNGTYTRLDYVAHSYINQSVNILIDLDSVNIYNENWVILNNNTPISQNVYSNILNFTYYFLKGTTNLVLIGTNSPPLAAYSYIENTEILIITPHYDENITYRAFLEYPRYSEAFSLNLSDSWNIDNIHYANNTYAIVNSTFFCEGFNEYTISSYLQFYTNPIQSFSVNIVGNSIILEINCSANIYSSYIRFPISDSYKLQVLNDSVDILFEYNDFNYYQFFQTYLEEGLNVISIPFVEYKINRSVYFLIPIIAVAGIVAFTYYRKKKEEKLSKLEEKKNGK